MYINELFNHLSIIHKLCITGDYYPQIATIANVATTSNY